LISDEDAGLGCDGSRFPKGIAAFISISEQIVEPFPIPREVQRINRYLRERFLSEWFEDTIEA
jgi:hypothetical protein